jgi:hypothetical protein
LNPEEEKLADEELEMVVQVIRRGLKDGDKLNRQNELLQRAAVTLKDAKRRLVAMNRIGNEIARAYQRAIDPQRKVPLTAAEAIERIAWTHEKVNELKSYLE